MTSRTSFSQFTIMVDFMERNGDLSKPSGGPRGRQWCMTKWRELTAKLNSEGTGESRTEEKWRKVWSDLKNNTKKKWAKINRSVQGTGGGPALKLTLTDLEHRVMAILGVQAAVGMAVPELGFGEVNEPREEPPASPVETQSVVVENDTPYSWPILDEDIWNTPHCSSGPTRVPLSQQLEPPSPPGLVTSPTRLVTSPTRPDSTTPVRRTSPPPRTSPTPNAPPAPRRKKRKITSTAMEDHFINLEMNAREADRERDRMYADLERESVYVRTRVGQNLSLISDKVEGLYLPYHAVIREDKETTKVRIVFDASCKGTNGVSLNDDLMVGPTLQSELRHLIMRWRVYPVCFIADIVKMYRQVKVRDEDSEYQRILWRESPEEEIKEYKLLRVTFGTSSAPYLAVCL